MKKDDQLKDIPMTDYKLTDEDNMPLIEDYKDNIKINKNNDCMNCITF